jgi:drug/metabolite transporter (DMT)-like permease
MAVLTNDRRAVATGSGLLLAITAAVSFGTSGALARGLLDAGWSPIAVVTARLTAGAVTTLPFAVRSLRGRGPLQRAHLRLVIVYGVLTMALAQLGYFSAVARMAVGPSLLIEYTAPAVVILWLWARRGERPTALAGAGAAVVAVGLVLVLGIISGTSLSTVGVLWALLAMLGAVGYYVLAASAPDDLPVAALSCGGLIIGAAFLAAVGAVGVLPLHATTHVVRYTGIGVTVAWWVPVLLLGTVAAALPYCAGIAGTRRLGSRIASFVGLLEVVSGVGFAWLLQSQAPGAAQFAGGTLVLAGVAIVKSGEPVASPEDLEGTAGRDQAPSACCGASSPIVSQSAL